MENILKDNAKSEKVDIKSRTLNFQAIYEKRINEVLKSFKSAGSLSVNNIRKFKELDLDLMFHMAFVQFTKQFLMFFRFLGPYCLQLEHPLIKWLSF